MNYIVHYSRIINADKERSHWKETARAVRKLALTNLLLLIDQEKRILNSTSE